MTDYQLIAAAINFIRENRLAQPPLEEIARHIGLSPYHVQRLFKRYAGVSPKRFLQHLTGEHAKQLLRSSASVLDVSFAVGLSGSGRLHDLLISVEAVTPGEYKAAGDGVEIRYGRHATPFGDCLIAVTGRGICRLEFFDSDSSDDLVARLRQEWPGAKIREDAVATGISIDRIFSAAGKTDGQSLPLQLKGTNFQLKVWQALLNIPPGCITSYGDLAERIGHPGASRAVGTAIGSNPIGYLIPCHRVLRGDGGIGGYRWGEERKLAILEREFGRHKP
ncbi:MAG: 6-O-methylguanine DNA methyltransferase [Desulfuromonas sp.]|nr:MAG: 6-O-methylguanine DNA methyltransferase [Desulfuromonas sp.]